MVFHCIFLEKRPVWFQTNLGRENSARYLEIQAGKTFSCQGHALVTLYVQFLCSDEIQLVSRVFCYSWLVCLLFFWLRDASLVKVGSPISDGIVFVFHLLEKSETILALLDTFQEVHLEWQAWVMIVVDVCFFISNLMKSCVVYAAI